MWTECLEAKKAHTGLHVPMPSTLQATLEKRADLKAKHTCKHNLRVAWPFSLYLN